MPQRWVIPTFMNEIWMVKSQCVANRCADSPGVSLGSTLGWLNQDVRLPGPGYRLNRSLQQKFYYEEWPFSCYRSSDKAMYWALTGCIEWSSSRHRAVGIETSRPPFWRYRSMMLHSDLCWWRGVEPLYITSTLRCRSGVEPLGRGASSLYIRALHQPICYIAFLQFYVKTFLRKNLDVKRISTFTVKSQSLHSTPSKWKRARYLRKRRYGCRSLHL